ncbi:metal-sensitive transcriptional regulator [Bacillaceae bacterium]
MKYTDAMKNRLKRIEGQARGVLRMMEENKDCKEVVSQLTAMRSAVDKAIALIIATNLEQCLRDQIERGEETEETINQAIRLLVKSR